MKLSELQMQSDWNVGKVNPKADPVKTGGAKGTEKPALKNESFEEILRRRLEGNDVKFSSHAIKRLDERSVPMDVGQLERLDSGFKMLEERGARNAVVMIDNAAYVVSVENRTVVTAMEPGQEGKNVFTNIDSLAIV